MRIPKIEKPEALKKNRKGWYIYQIHHLEALMNFSHKNYTFHIGEAILESEDKLLEMLNDYRAQVKAISKKEWLRRRTNPMWYWNEKIEL